MFFWVKRVFLWSLLIFVVGTFATMFIPLLMSFLIQTTSRSGGERAMIMALFTPFLLLALVSGLLLLVLKIWNGVRRLF